MKKAFISFLFSIFLVSNSFAIDYSCFRNSWYITNVPNDTFLLITDSLNNYYFQDWNILNNKILETKERKYYNFKYLEDNKDYSVLSLDFEQYNLDKDLIIKFNNTLNRNTFNYTFLTNNNNYYFEISNDWKNWFKIQDNIKNYDLDYLKISFNNKNLKNTYIYELSFYTLVQNKVLINSLSTSDIFVYNDYYCKDDELKNLVLKTNKTLYFPTTKYTKTFNLEISENKNFNENHIIDYINRDTDNDWIIDTEDNCPFHFNPDQLDSTANWIWDICDDKDKDLVIWLLDNCPLFFNPDQKDENNNWIWDACEIDTDDDWIYDVIDNCPFVDNYNQLDSDNDWIWDECDNCPFKFNSNQKDIDKDWIWDLCDDNDDRFLESNKIFFMTFIIVISLIFLFWIFIVSKKLRS